MSASVTGGLPKLVRLITRASPLALRQAELAAAHIHTQCPGIDLEIIPVKTTGDRRMNWSLQEKGGKGLFTKELEEALLAGDADLAVHSAKDLPTDQPPGLALAGFLPRERVHDVLVIKQGVIRPGLIASGSPRRRAQVKPIFPQAVWTEIRGNVQTRLKKVAQGEADATLLAAAGLKRLGIHSWPGLDMKPLDARQVIPAAGQAAIALQCRADDEACYRMLTDPLTHRAITVERTILAALGGGCQLAAGVCCLGSSVHIFEESLGKRIYQLEAEERRPWLEQAEHIGGELRALLAEAS